MDCKIVKIGQGTSAPKKFKSCIICGNEIKNYRFEEIKPDRKVYRHVSCICEIYLKVRDKWWFKFFNR